MYDFYVCAWAAWDTQPVEITGWVAVAEMYIVAHSSSDIYGLRSGTPRNTATMSSSNNRNASNVDSKAGGSTAAEKSKGKVPRVKKERPRERPVSKFEDLIMHGVKPWDDDADEFYDALVQARIELDRDLDAMDAEDAKKDAMNVKHAR